MALAFFEEVLADIAEVGSDRELFELFVDLGDELEELTTEMKIPENKVPGCVSNVYIATELQADGTVKFHGSSESLTVKGYVYVLCQALSGLKPEEVLDAEDQVSHFIEHSGLAKSVVRSRANAVPNVYLLMREQVQGL